MLGHSLATAVERDLPRRSGTCTSRINSVIAIAITPSAKVSNRAVSEALPRSTLEPPGASGERMRKAYVTETAPEAMLPGPSERDDSALLLAAGDAVARVDHAPVGVGSAVVRVVPRHVVPALQEVVAVAAEQVVVARPAVDLVVLVVALEPVAQDEDLPLAAAPLGARPASTEALLDELLVIGLSLEDVRPVA